jgi:hypothetical protein
MTGILAIGVAWAVGPAAVPAIQRNRQDTVPARRYSCSLGSLVALTLVILILIGYVVVVLKWEAFADYDDAFLTLFTLKGYNLAPSIWPATGRFYPLAQLEFNLVRHFTSSVVGYHAVPIGELVTISCLILFLDTALPLTARAALTAVCLALPSIVSAFTALVFPDRNVVFWLACLLFFLNLFDKTLSTKWAIAAAVSAQIMIYYKETAFLLLLGFALGRLMLRCRRADGKGWDYSLLRLRESRLDVCFICLAVIFLLYYASVMIAHPNIRYADLNGVSWNKAILSYLRFDPLALVSAFVVLGRSYLILRGELVPSPFWDGLALGGVACYAAYICLRLFQPYYLAPVDFIAVLYVGRLVILSWKNMANWGMVATALLVLAVLLQNISLSAFRLYERENLMHARSELADAIVSRRQSDPSHVQRLFFAFSIPYVLTEFASYLIYRGLPIEGYDTSAKSVNEHQVVIVSKLFIKDELCVDYRSFVCHAGGTPMPGDLVIELPDDRESLAQIGPYRTSGQSLFTYGPRPRISQWMSPLLSAVHPVSVLWYAEFPDRWMDASLTISK